MKKTLAVTLFAAVFAAGIAVGSYAARGGDRVRPSAWEGLSPRDAAAHLLEIAHEQAENGSWENIDVARVHYLAGNAVVADAVFERYTDKDEASDLIRIGRIYAHNGEWVKSKPYFDRVVEMEPDDADWLAEIGAFYNLNGDREHAEELFARSFDEDSRDLENTLTAAGSYLQVPPRKR